MSSDFPDLGDWHPTRRSLHVWSRVLSAVRGALGEPHPRWWHISLAVTSRGLTTGPLGGEAAKRLAAELDLTRHELTLRRRGQILDSLSLAGPQPAGRVGAWLLDRLASDHGLVVETAGDKWRDDSPRRYEPAAAERYRRAAHSSAQVLAAVRDDLAGERGPVQLWAHHFDVSFELFGSRWIESEGGQQSAQIGFGFFPGDDRDPRAYFYGTPWPFEDELLDAPLPPLARWQKEPWEGARLPYSAAVSGGAPLLGEFFHAVNTSGRSVLGGPDVDDG